MSAPLHPDAELIATCEAVRRLEEQLLAVYYGPNAPTNGGEQMRRSDEVHERIWPTQESLLARVAELQARTLEELQAKARVYVTHDPDLGHLEGLGSFTDVVLSIVRDLVGDYDPVAALSSKVTA